MTLLLGRKEYHPPNPSSHHRRLSGSPSTTTTTTTTTTSQQSAAASSSPSTKTTLSMSSSTSTTPRAYRRSMSSTSVPTTTTTCNNNNSNAANSSSGAAPQTPPATGRQSPLTTTTTTTTPSSTTTGPRATPPRRFQIRRSLSSSSGVSAASNNNNNNNHNNSNNAVVSSPPASRYSGTNHVAMMSKQISTPPRYSMARSNSGVFRNHNSNNMATGTRSPSLSPAPSFSPLPAPPPPPPPPPLPPVPIISSNPQQQQEQQEELSSRNAEAITPLSPSSHSSSIDNNNTSIDNNPHLTTTTAPVTTTPSPGAVGSCVQVAVRVRPLLASEEGSDHCMQVLKNNAIRIGGSSGPRFTFDQVFDADTPQADFYQRAVAPLVASCLQGYNATILAYGQTGSGKTFTIMGPSAASAVSRPDELAGVIPRAIRSLFDLLDQEMMQQPQAGSRTSMDYNVHVQFLELYGEEIRDLLSVMSSVKSSSGPPQQQQQLVIRDLGTDEPEVLGATQVPVSSADEALQCLTAGMLRRVTGATAMNATSSRSHAILSVVVEQKSCILTTNPTTTTAASSPPPQQPTSSSPLASPAATTATTEERVQIKRSKFNFVDLAGSERQKRTQAEGQRLKEGIDINKGLLVLGNVISALGDPRKRGKTFVPYRDSKLTRLLKGSLGGNHKTLMVACVSPAACNMDESLNCLRYANRAKNIQNMAVVNVDASSRLVAHLQEQVAALATDLLRVYDGDWQSTFFSRATLQHLASGGATDMTSLATTSENAAPNHLEMPMLLLSSPSSSMPLASSPQQVQHPPPPLVDKWSSSSRFSSQSTTLTDNKNFLPRTDDHERQIRDLQIELTRTRDQLREAQKHHDAAEEELYVVKAERELYQLQLSVLTDNLRGNKTTGTSPSTVVNLDAKDRVFLDKAVAYEAEIAQWKERARAAEAQASRALWCLQEDMMSPDSKRLEEQNIAKVKRALEEDRSRLLQLQSAMNGGNGALITDLEDTLTNPKGNKRIVSNLQRSLSNQSSSDQQLDAEEQKEQASLRSLTQKYLNQGGHVDDESFDNDDGSSQPSPGDDANVSALADGEAEGDAAEIPPEKKRLLQSDLIELSRSIAAKEDLIDQLKLSQEKYASMREFYEEKLRQMEEALHEKEQERAQLIADLEKAKHEEHPRANLEDQLKEKDQHIANLRRRQKELRDLTAVSSRNDSEISRLQSDVSEMKRKKVDLQKQLGEQAKTHANEMKKLQQTNLQKERELNKYKRLSSQREAEARKANLVAKARLDEIGQLRSKYKDAEKRLRTLSVKRGVMAKAGLDPVLVGRRDSKMNKSLSGTGRNNSTGGGKTIDADSLRDYFDQKVAEVVRKEALVEKLAEEWEEHYDLVTRRKELEESKEDDSAAEEELQSLSVQIQFKEDRIRQLAQRVGKKQQPQSQPNASTKTPQDDGFLFGPEFAKLCAGTTRELAKGTAARVLFGMIVRERRRIAALARTASSLDEKLQIATKTAETNEAALRSYMDEQRQELAALTQTQQDQILSLMDMIKEETDIATLKDALSQYRENGVLGDSAGLDPKAMSLENEHLNILERQLSEAREQARAGESYRLRMEELEDELAKSCQDSEDLQDELSGVRSALRQIREMAWRLPSEDSKEDIASLGADILDVVNHALHPAHGPSPKNKRKQSLRQPGLGSEKSQDRSFLNPRIKKHIELMHTSDSADDADDPVWALEIMEDLALIAEGKVPPSLGGSPVFMESGTQLSVFDRLTDPQNFTGIQKVAVGRKKKTHKKVSSPNRSEKKPISKGGSENADHDQGHGEVSNKSQSAAEQSKISEPDAAGGTDAKEHGHLVETKEHQSVFDRLVSPSHYTGTQKEKFQLSRAKRDHVAEEVADRLLDNLLKQESDSAHKRSEREREIAHRKAVEYTQLNVFERLQRTTTQSFAVKHSLSNLSDIPGHDTASHNSHDTHEDTRRSTTTTSDSQHGDNGSISDNYTSQDVFERLTRTTTEAYAKKTNRIKRS